MQGSQERQLLQVYAIAGALGQCLYYVHAKAHQFAALLEVQRWVVVGEQVEVCRACVEGEEVQQAHGEALHESSLMK
ncbi:hypothetical protein D3C76_1811210 [compost metagenome]